MSKIAQPKKTWIQYGIIALIAIVLYATGMHTEVIAFAQRGLLATGLMNPDVQEIAQLREKQNGIQNNTEKIKADLDFALIDSEGNSKSLKDFRGKVIFLNLWATWCPPCIAEMPNIDSLHEEMGDEIAFVMLSLDQDFEKAINFNKYKEYDLPIFKPASYLPRMYESNSIPTTYVIDADGYLALTHYGMADYDSIEFKNFLKSLK